MYPILSFQNFFEHILQCHLDPLIRIIFQTQVQSEGIKRPCNLPHVEFVDQSAMTSARSLYDLTL